MNHEVFSCQVEGFFVLVTNYIQELREASSSTIGGNLFLRSTLNSMHFCTTDRIFDGIFSSPFIFWGAINHV